MPSGLRLRRVACGPRRNALVLSSQVLSELYVTVTRKLAEPLPIEQALQVVADLAAFPVTPVDAALVQRAAALSSGEQLACWDALIVVAAAEAGADTVYSEDLQAGRSYGGVTVVDPFSS